MVSVNIQAHSNVKFVEKADISNFTDFNRTWIMTVRSDDIVATVTCVAGIYATEKVVVSCLVAGLRLIDNHWIFDSAAKQIANQLGFYVDRSVPEYIAQVDFSNATRYDISIPLVICNKMVSEPHYEVTNLGIPGGVHVRMTIEIDGIRYASLVTLPGELWLENPSLYMDLARNNLFEQMYIDKPHLSPEICRARYGTYTVQNNEKTDNYRDNRVDKLPGLKETVTHPISKDRMTVEKAVINLNDVHHWTREQIADWLDTLDIDLRFK
jgi:hypothetical protein